MERKIALELVQIVYTSAATSAIPNKELAEILNVARRNNHSVKVSGILVCSDKSFLQVLEGPRVAVEAIYGRIETDSRHENTSIIRKQVIEEREFGDWSMAFVNSDGSSDSHDGYVDYLRGLDAISAGNGAARKVLRGFLDGKWRAKPDVAPIKAA